MTREEAEEVVNAFVQLLYDREYFHYELNPKVVDVFLDDMEASGVIGK